MNWITKHAEGVLILAVLVIIFICQEIPILIDVYEHLFR